MIAIDVGYSFVKGVSSDKRILIPSVHAPYRDLVLGDLSKNGIGHVVKIRKVDGTVSQHFIGQMALREGHATSFTMDREKHRHPAHDLLVLTSARLLGARTGETLVAGLPVAYYRTQKEELQRHLEGIHAEISVNHGSPERVSFGKVLIYPQGAGALLTAPDMPNSGLALLVDVGFNTTDFILAEIVRGNAKPVSTYCGSIETGVFDMHDYIAQEFLSATGAPLATLRVREIIENEGVTMYFGKELNLGAAIKSAQNTVARLIADQVQAAIGERYPFLRKIYLAGGGIDAMPEILKYFPGASVIPDPQWANAVGFHSFVRQLETA